MKHHHSRILAVLLFLPCIVQGQTQTPAPSATPLPTATPAPTAAPSPMATPVQAAPSMTTGTIAPPAEEAIKATLPPASVPSAEETPKPMLIPVPAPQEKAVPVIPVDPTPSTPLAKGEIRLNFQNAALSDVLNYLSEAAGFVIVQETPVSGTVNIVSRQSINLDEAVDLLNAVLAEKGYTAIRNNRILKIVSRSNAQKLDIPVMAGSDPTQIPRKDGVVTQILPVRYVEALKLVDNLRPLLSADASISANEASNSILLADSQTNIHRIAEIIHALDTSLASISTIRIFQLQYADSKSLAGVLTQLFTTSQPNQGNANQPQGGGGGRGRGGFMGFPGMGGAPAAPTQNQAQQAATKVVAVADEQSNSVIVSAPDALLPSIADIVARIDTNIADFTETRIFKLQFADSMELANILATLYSDTGTTGRPNNNQPNGQQQQAAPAQSSNRSLLQSRVVAVPDPRTNSLIISAARDTMSEIAVTVGRLDASDSKKQHVYIHRLENADPDNVATILRGMFGNQTSSAANTQPSASRLNQRTTNGASSDVTNALNTSSSNGR